MILLLALPVLAVVALAHRYLQIYAPSNVLIRRVRASRPRLSTVVMLIALTGILLVAMKLTSSAAEAGALGWLNLAVLLLAWDAIKIALLAVLQMGRLFVAFAARRRDSLRTWSLLSSSLG
jgi:hypothetical protein